MKILIIASDIGKSAPGIVYEKLIQGISINNEVHILTADFRPNVILSRVKHITTLKKNYIHPRVSKLLISILGVNPYDLYWSMKAFKLISNNKVNYSIVCSFISFHNYIGLISGSQIAKKFNIKHAVYSVDAIPAPGWPENKGYYIGVKRLMRKYLKNVDALFSSNKHMLEYQMSTFKPKKQVITDVIYNPSDTENLKEYPFVNNNINYFLYTGGIYGVRNPEYLFTGFEKYLKKYPNSKLVFVGTKFNEEIFSNLNDSTRNKIEIHPFTRNLNVFYCNSLALIDIDADIENDVFVSSKIINYLSVNRIIISETGKNSPSRKLFANCESIIQCDHNSDQMFAALCKATEIKNEVSFASRRKLLEKFSIKNTSIVFEQNLSKLI